MKKRLCAFALILIMLFCVVSCGDGEKTYEKGGFSITLPKRFIDITRLTDGADACFSDMKSTFVVTATKLDFEEVGDDSMTAKEFANHIVIANQNNFTSFVTEEYGTPSFRYSMTIDDEQYTYITFAYVTDAYWTVSFAFPRDTLSENEDKVFEYEKTVKFN